MVVTTFQSQIYISKLFDPEVVTLQHLSFAMLGEPLHIASIISMSICSWKPIIMTACKYTLLLKNIREISLTFPISLTHLLQFHFA